MTTTQSEVLNFYWHCEVAAMVIRQLPATAATRSNSRHAVRMATLCAAGHKGVTHASAGARDRQRATGAAWHKCELVKEHAVPVSHVHARVVEALSTDFDEQARRAARQALAEDLAARGLPAAEIAALPCSPDAWRVAQVVRAWTQLAWLTKDDDRLLRSKSLHDGMPADWDEVDRLARYRACGIEVAEI
jgi:hypothetical protein